MGPDRRGRAPAGFLTLFSAPTRREQGGGAATSRRTFLRWVVFLPAALVHAKTGPAEAVSVAPVPINPYSARKRRLVFKEYIEEMERRIEAEETAQALVEEEHSFAVSCTAGVLASAVSTSLSHPIDTAKARIQMGQAPLVLTDRFLGLSSLYRGVGPNIAKEAPNAGIYLGVYEAVKDVLSDHFVLLSSHPLVLYMLAGAIGDAVGSVVRVPAEIISKRLQVGMNGDWKSAFVEAFLSEEGRKGSLNVWGAVLLRDVPFGALQIGIYEQVKEFVSSSTSAPIPALLSGALAGAMAGMISAFLTTPSDVLVTRLSAQNPQSYLETRRYMGIVGTWRRIVGEGGFMALWKGSFQRSLYYLPLCGLFFALYEVFCQIMSNPQMLVDISIMYEDTIIRWLSVSNGSPL